MNDSQKVHSEHLKRESVTTGCLRTADMAGSTRQIASGACPEDAVDPAPHHMGG
jgi:hypothetical protein